MLVPEDISACGKITGVGGLEAAGVGGRMSIGDNIGDALLKTDGPVPEVGNAGRGEGVAIDG